MATPSEFPASSIRDGLDERIPGVGIEEDVDLGGHVIGQVKKLLPGRYGNENHGSAFFYRMLDHAHGMVEGGDGAPQIQPTDDDLATLQALADQGTTQRQQAGDTQRLAAFGRLKSPQLQRELMLAWIPIPDEFTRPGVEVLLGVFDTLGKWVWGWTIENPDAAARAFCHLNAIEAWGFLLPAGTDGPHLPGRQWIAADLVFPLQLRCDHKGFDRIGSKGIAELRVAKLRGMVRLVWTLMVPRRNPRMSEAAFLVCARAAIG